MRRVVGAALLGGFVAFASSALAQNYPDRPIRVISPNPPGGANDTIVRIVTAKMAPLLGATIVIDNRGGGAGKIGAEVAAHAAADGYTLLAGSVSTHSFAPITTPRLAYDPVKDFAPISLFALVQNVLVVPPNSPATDLRALVALAKAHPGRLNYASGGPGSTSHFAVAMFVALAGILRDTVHVPYKGGNPALMATMTGEAQFYFGPIAGMVPFIKAGSVRALAISGDERSPELPDVPTMAEAGMPDYKAVSWFGLLAPAGTPPAIVDKLSTAVGQAVADPEVAAALRNQGIVPKSDRPTEFAVFIAEQLDLHRKLVDEAGLKFEQ